MIIGFSLLYRGFSSLLAVEVQDPLQKKSAGDREYAVLGWPDVSKISPKLNQRILYTGIVFVSE